MVRAQGGTPEAVRLGQWSQHFYRRQHDELGIDSGFVTQGYLLPCFTEAEVTRPTSGWPCRPAGPGRGVARARTRWTQRNPTLAPGQTLGGTFFAADGYIPPPRNVTAYAVALASSRRRRARAGPVPGLRREGPGHRRADQRRADHRGPVVLTGGPKLAEVGQLAGLRIPVGGVRHQVAVTEPHPDLDPSRLPMVFDLASGLYWRPEEGGLLFGMSNPEEPPGGPPRWTSRTWPGCGPG